MTLRHDLLYITVKYHDYIQKGIQVKEQTQICIKKHHRGDNSKSNKGRALFFVHNTSSWPVLHNCEVSSKYSKRYSSYCSNTKMFTDGQTESWQTDVRHIFCMWHIIMTCSTSSWPVLHNCEVSSKYSKRYSSYWADKRMFMDRRMDRQTDDGQGQIDRRRTDARLIAISPQPFGREIKS